jgi:hypothetical protein
MVEVIDLPSEILREICLYVFLISPSDIVSEYSIPTNDLDIAMQDRLSLITTYSNSKALTNSFSTGLSALHNSPEHTVNEVYDVYDAVIRHRCPRKSLFALNITCKRLHEIAKPLFWTLLETDQESTNSIGDLVKVLHTVTKRPELGRHIKALAFRHFSIYPEYEPSFSAVEKAEMSTLLQYDSTQQVASLFDLLPNLRSLKLTIELEPDYFSVFHSSILYPSGFPLGLQNLTEFSLHWEDPDADAFWASMVLPLFSLPSLKTLYLGRPMAAVSSPSSPSRELSDITRYQHTSSITTLIIDFGLVAKEAITAFCKLPKALENFSYSYGGGSNRCSNAEIGEYFAALLPQKSSLRKLEIRGCRDLQTSEDESAPDPAILRSFLALTEFACPIRLLLFREEGGNSASNYKLEDVLPPNVQKLTLFAYDDWTFDKLSNELKNFFSFGKRKLEGLKEMRAEVWLKEEDYKLHRGRKEGEAEALGVIRSRVESLKIRGRDKGVRLEVELDTVSKTEMW